MLEVFHLRRRAYSDFGLYEASTEGHDDSAASTNTCEGDRRCFEDCRSNSSMGPNNVNCSQHDSSPSSSRSRERTRSSSPSYTAGRLAAKAFNLMVTFPDNAGDSERAMYAYENSARKVKDSESFPDVSHLSDGGLRIAASSPGQVKSAPSTPLSDERASRHLSRHGTFVAPDLSPPPCRVIPPTYEHIPYLHPLPDHCPTPQSYRPMKLKTTTFTKHNRDRTSKSLSSKETDTKKKNTSKKSPKKLGMKGSMSLIDLVVASTEKVTRWSYVIPESDEEVQIIRRRKVNSGIVRSSSAGSINKLQKRSTPSSDRSIVPMEEDDSGIRRATASSFGESDTITTTDNDEEDKGEDWKNTESSQGKEQKHALKNLSRSTPAMSPSGSPRHSDSEVPARLSRINKVFRKKFSSVSTNEKVINYYACAIVSDILLQGTLYITENYFAFYSNIFGYVNRTILPIVDVASIQKEKTAKFIPNAVGVQMFDGKTYVFSSLISRDSTYKFMIHTWRKSRKLTDSDSEPPFIVRGPKEDDEESEPNSVDSNCDDDSVDNGIVEGSSVSSHNDAVWSQSSPVILSNSLGSSADNSGHVTPITLARESLPSVTSVDSMENDKLSSKRSLQSKDSEACSSSSSSQWIVHTNIINSVLHVGVAPLQAVREGLHEITYLPKTSILLIISSALVFLLLTSAAFMIYRVEILSQHINFSPSDEYTSNLYEEVLRMQQKLHSATAEEVEKTLSLQIKQLATVRQSLDALTYLFNKEAPQPSSQIQENT